jgi:hypothetical protein
MGQSMAIANPNNGHGPTWSFTEAGPQQIMKQLKQAARFFHVKPTESV